jgi:hypothetical protein
LTLWETSTLASPIAFDWVYFRQVTSRRTAKKIFEEEMLIAKGAKEV